MSTKSEENKKIFSFTLFSLLGLVMVGMLAMLFDITACTRETASQPMSDSNQALILNEGQIAKVSGTDLTIEVKRVLDFTSRGCLGGPVGCPDQAQMEVTQGEEREQVILYLLHTQSLGKQTINQLNVFRHKNQADVLGYKIVLTGLQGKQITLSIKRINNQEGN